VGRKGARVKRVVRRIVVPLLASLGVFLVAVFLTVGLPGAVVVVLVGAAMEAAGWPALPAQAMWPAGLIASGVLAIAVFPASVALSLLRPGLGRWRHVLLTAAIATAAAAGVAVSMVLSLPAGTGSEPA